MRKFKERILALTYSASLVLIYILNIAPAQANEDIRVLASWICRGDNIGLHRQKNGADGVFSDYVPLNKSAEIHLTSTKDGYAAMSIHSQDDSPVLISSIDDGSSVLWSQSEDKFNEHFWAYKPNYSIELYKEKISPTTFYAYEISTTFYDTLEGKTKLRQFTSLYTCERVSPVSVNRLKVVHRSEDQSYTCLQDPFRIGRDNKINVDGKNKSITFSSVEADTFSFVAKPNKFSVSEMQRNEEYDFFKLENYDMFAINPTSLVGIRIVAGEVVNTKYQCVMN